jgi:hypothetical protein
MVFLCKFWDSQFNQSRHLQENIGLDYSFINSSDFSFTAAKYSYLARLSLESEIRAFGNNFI